MFAQIAGAKIWNSCDQPRLITEDKMDLGENYPNFQGWTLNFESTRHSGEWPSKCTRLHQFSLAKKFTPTPHLPVLAIFNFYYSYYEIDCIL